MAAPRQKHPRTSAPPTKTPIPDMNREYEAEIERITGEWDKTVAEAEELRQTVLTLRAQLDSRDAGSGEAAGIITRLRSERDEATRNMAEAVDALRSSSIAAHMATHKGAYGKCEDSVCGSARRFWDLVGQADGLTQTLVNPGAFWEASENRLLPVFDAEKAPPPTPDEDLTDGELPEIEPLETEPLTKTDDDLELDPKYAGKRLVMVRVPDPQKEKDPDDPGMPKARI